jgi:uncharacterized protein (TIGR02246 family)
MHADEHALRAAHADWIAAVNAGALDPLLAAMTDDVVFLGPGGAPFGRDGFVAGFTAGHANNRIVCVSELQEVGLAGDFAFTRCADSLSVTPRGGGDVVRMAGDRLTVHRRDAHGRWLLARDAHTLTVVPG